MKRLVGWVKAAGELTAAIWIAAVGCFAIGAFMATATELPAAIAWAVILTAFVTGLMVFERLR